MLGEIWIDERIGLDRFGEPVLGGIPVTQGALAGAAWADGRWFEAGSGDGQRYALEGTAAAWWPDGSVKWLHLCGKVDLAGGKRNVFSIEPADTPGVGGLVVERDGEAVDIVDGERAVRIGGGGVIEAPLVEGVSAALVFTDADDCDRRRFMWQAGPAEVVVATASRVVVRVGGSFVDASGAAGSELMLFIEALAGEDALRLMPVFIYGGASERELMRALTLSVRTTLGGEEAAYAFSQARGPGYTDGVRSFSQAGPRWREARLLQLGSSFYRIDKRVSAGDPWVKASEGTRAVGWCHLTDRSGGVTAAMRDFWQAYPHELHIDAEAGVMTFGLWPASASPMDFRRYAQTVYGRPIYEYCPPHFTDQQWDPAYGAAGIARSHELLLRFHPSTLSAVDFAGKYEQAKLNIVDPGSDVASRAMAFVNPCRIMPEPARFAESGVVGRLAAAGTVRGRGDEPEGAADAERLMTAVADFIVAERDVRRWYGQYDYGDVQLSFYTPLDRWAYDHGGYAWINTECLPDYGLWLAALRAGRADWFDAAIAMTRHNRDVDMYHRGPFRGYGTRHNVNHWGCACKESRVSMPLTKRLHYYLTADPWTREGIENTMDAFAAEPRHARFAPDHVSIFAAAYAVWEITGAEADRQRVERFMDALAAGIDDEGRYVHLMVIDPASGQWRIEDATRHDGPCFFLNKFGGLHALIEASELLKHDGLRDALIRYARYTLRVELDPVMDLQYLMAMAYRTTGEAAFGEAVDEALGQCRPAAVPDEYGVVHFGERGGEGPLQMPRHTVLEGLNGTNKVMSHPLALVLHTCPYGLAHRRPQ